MKPLVSSYNFADSEKKWQEYWEAQKTYKWNKDESRENSFVVDTPPPTVSGQLHMGHIFSYTQTDFIVRYQRMIGKNIFYPIGFDDNGLPTERLVEKQKNIKAVNTDRAEFIKICSEIIEDEEKKFQSLFSSMALSVDWSLKYQTISKTSSIISQSSFLDLANKGEIYRTEQPILWDPVDQTALAQADIEDKEKNSEMHDIAFGCENGEKLIIATTRPELLPACVAVFYHPEDSRYARLKDKFAFSPLFGAKLPIFPDELVNPDKGTGLVMCSTFGDTTDIAWWKKHKLPLKIVLDKKGRFLENISFDTLSANKIYASIATLKVTEAREKLLSLLKEEGLLLKSTPIVHSVKCAERSGAPLEIITSPQWFVKTIAHKEELLARSNELNWYPKTMKIKLDNWINAISWDWCISRQRFFGVPFPVWYSKRKGEEGKIIFASQAQLPVDPLMDLPVGYSKDEVIPDMDVMDTWATSSVSPQLSSHAITEEWSVDYGRHKNLFPFDLRPQAHEILRTWAFYTILKSHLHENTLPWKNIMVSGWCLAEDKTKMSKSKGNSTSPENLIITFGADVIRHWASTSRLGADTAFSEEFLKIGKKLVNKIWNAAKFASNHFEKITIPSPSLEDLVREKVIFHDTDLWLLAKLNNVITEATNELSNYEYAAAIEIIEKFFWRDFCDNYLEISKSRCYNENGDDNLGQKSAILTLFYSLQLLLKMFAIYLPHITEEIYSSLYDAGKSIHSRGNWPKAIITLANQSAIDMGEKIIDILNLVRKAKAAKNLSMKASIATLAIPHNLKFSNEALADLASVTNSHQIIEADNFSDYEQMVEDDGSKLKIGLRYSI